jgi:hypothetical protein
MRFDTHLERTTTMKNLFVICAATLLVAGMAFTASAADSVPANTLSSMGFGSVSVMSDDAGLTVRGKGSFATVWGSSSAVYGNRNGIATSNNNYAAGAANKWGGSSANGGSTSYAGNANGVVGFGGGGVGGIVKFNVNFSGGGAHASAR